MFQLLGVNKTNKSARNAASGAFVPSKKQRIEQFYQKENLLYEQNENIATDGSEFIDYATLDDSDKAEFDAYDEEARRRFYMVPNARRSFKSRLEESAVLYKRKKMLFPVPLLDRQPEVMPCWIRSLNDIKNLSEADTMVFLRAYRMSTRGPLNELKKDLAILLGVDYRDAYSELGLEIPVNYDMNNNIGADESEFIDYAALDDSDKAEFDAYDEEARRRFYMVPNARRSFKSRLEESAVLYKRKKMLFPVPLLDRQPEVMPCWIRSLNDIKNLSEADTMVFLRAYRMSTRGPLNELKKDLAILLGVDDKDAQSAFGVVVPELQIV